MLLGDKPIHYDVPMPPDLESNVAERLSAEDLLEAWQLLVPEDRLESFRALPRPEAEDLFLSLSARDQAELIRALPSPERRSWMRLLPPDDAADLVQVAEVAPRGGPLIPVCSATSAADISCRAGGEQRWSRWRRYHARSRCGSWRHPAWTARRWRWT